MESQVPDYLLAYWTKIVAFCNYRERSHKEVTTKLYSYKLNKSAVETLTLLLLENNLLNEERFASAFVHDKININHWGMRKIIENLKPHAISPYCLKIAISKVDPILYEHIFNMLAQKKWKSLQLTKKTYLQKQHQLRQFLYQRGFESYMIQDFLTQVNT